jgi:GNAT superfamily N-acetyltransferase
MSQIWIEPFDAGAASSKVWAAFHVYRRAIAAELHPDDPIVDDAQCEYEMRRDDPLWEVRRWAASGRADIVGTASVWYRRSGTPYAEDHAWHLRCFGSVRADMRRQGVGSSLLQKVLHLMRVLDKTVLTLSAHTGAGHAFLQQIGAVSKLSSIESRATLAALDWPRLRSWEDGVRDLGLRWECYADRVPRPVLISLVPAFTALIGDIPLGSLEIAPIRFEIEGYDEFYKGLDRFGGAHHLVLLREQGGALAGMSEASWNSQTAETAFQAFTGVARPWRGRGLARALKAALLRQVHTVHPEAKTMRTSNAEANAAMLSINQRVGFRPHLHYSEYQVTRAELETTAFGRLTD